MLSFWSSLFYEYIELLVEEDLDGLNNKKNLDMGRECSQSSIIRRIIGFLAHSLTTNRKYMSVFVGSTKMK